MTVAEYVAAFASILIGLAVADLATSLHRLIRHRDRVKWDWLLLAAALLVLLSIVNFWWGGFLAWSGRTSFSFAEFLLTFFTLLVLFLLSAAVLPDEADRRRIDLRLYYRRNARYFWSLFAVYIILTTLSNTVRAFASTNWDRTYLGSIAGSMAGNFMLAMVLAGLAITRRRWVHSVVISVLLAVVSLQWMMMAITNR